MKLTTAILDAITGDKNNQGRKVALCRLVNEVSPKVCDLRRPHVMAQFLAQVLHESGRLRYVREVWGPTRAQRGYEGRKDLGNTMKGDGKRFMGRDFIQTTGRANYRAFSKWAHDNISRTAPDFEAMPHLLEDPEWLGWSALWYWTTRIPARYVDDGNIEMITRRVNGGLNGFQDRLELFDRSALVLLGYGPEEVAAFQKDAGLVVDGISGPRTRSALHGLLSAHQEAQEDVEAPVEAPQPSIWAILFQIIFGAKK